MQEMQELPKVNNNYNHDLPKVSYKILIGNLTCPKLVKLLSHLPKSVKVTSNLPDFGLKPAT